MIFVRERGFHGSLLYYFSITVAEDRGEWCIRVGRQRNGNVVDKTALGVACSTTAEMLAHFYLSFWLVKFM